MGDFFEVCKRAYVIGDEDFKRIKRPATTEKIIDDTKYMTGGFFHRGGHKKFIRSAYLAGWFNAYMEGKR